MALNTGDVIKVVTRAIVTIIENSAGVRIPRSRPTFSTTSSTSPRVLSRHPRANAFFESNHITRAPVNAPPILPVTATAMMMKV